MRVLLSRWLGVLLLAAALAGNFVANAAPSFPPLTGRVVDQAGILTPDVENALGAKLEALESATSRQLVVVTILSLQGYEIEDYGYQLGRQWGIGEARRNTGVLFLVAPNERRVRIEVGYGLEPVLTDAFANAILVDAVLPLFRNGKVSDGVVAGVDALVAQLSLPEVEAMARLKDDAAGEAETDPLSIIFTGLVALWFVLGLISLVRGRGTGVWLWPLFFLMRHGGRGGGDHFRGRGGSFGGGGASGRW